jgi:hypothetical protein
MAHRKGKINMSRLTGANFMRQWREVYSNTNPGQRLDRWEIGQVEWTRDRHAHWGPDISFHIEIHRIVCKVGERIVWSLLVVSERWFAEDREKVLRTTEFTKLLSGRAEQVTAWFASKTRD